MRERVESTCRKFLFLAAVWIVIAVHTAFGQAVPKMSADANPSFEVATIKPSDPNDHNYGFHLSGHSIFIENQTVNSLISFAYSVQQKQIAGGPAWFGTDRFDIKGVPDAEGEPSWQQQKVMLQKLLADRFKITFHREKRELSIYAITVLKSGPKLATSKSDPNALADQTGNGNGSQQMVKYTNNSMAEFALALQSNLDRPVVDQTGLNGKFDFSLEWTSDQSQAADSNAAPVFFTAIQEQLGLKIEATKGLADVLVIDHVERPSDN